MALFLRCQALHFIADMFIARQLKENNIAEYLIYMWQTEDMIRANELDINKIESTIISGYQIGEDEKKQLSRWYEDLISMMREEGVVQYGHLQINKNVIINLTELHRRLLDSPKFPYYSAAYYKALPFIVELRGKKEKKEQPEIESCFEALYGVLLLKLRGKNVSKETMQAIEAISTLLRMLAGYYKKDRNGEPEIE